MKELQDIINDLQARLAIVGGGRIIITSDHVSISLGKEHEYFEVQENRTDYDGDDLDEDLDAEDVFEAQNSKSPTQDDTDVEMFKTMYNY